LKQLVFSDSQGWISSSKNLFLPDLRLKPVKSGKKTKCQYRGMVQRNLIHCSVQRANVPHQSSSIIISNKKLHMLD